MLNAEQCLMPLCPTCIREHTFYHQELHTKPQYYNIHQTVLEVRDSLSSSITKLGQIKKRTVRLVEFRATLTSRFKLGRGN